MISYTTGCPDCEETSKHPIIPCQGKNGRVTFKNPNRHPVLKADLDKCATIKGLRCDYLVVDRNGPKIEEIFVELKGSHITHAVKQLRSTIEQISKGKADLPKICYVSAKRVPVIRTVLQQHKDDFKIHFRATLIVKGHEIEHTFS